MIFNIDAGEHVCADDKIPIRFRFDLAAVLQISLPSHSFQLIWNISKFGNVVGS